MSDGLVRDTHAHVEAERETEEVVDEHERLQRQRLLRARLQILGRDPYQPAYDDGQVERARNDDGRGAVHERQALGHGRACELHIEDLADQRMHSQRHLPVQLAVQPPHNLHRPHSVAQPPSSPRFRAERGQRTAMAMR
jgi:hypothetical protein